MLSASLALSLALLSAAAPTPAPTEATDEPGSSTITLAEPPSAEGKDDPFLAEFEACQADARARARSPEAALPLMRAFNLRDRLGSPFLLARLYGQFVESRIVHPDVRALARFLLAQVERSRGRLPRAEENIRKLGFVTRLRVIGPFDNEGKRGATQVFPPEKELDFSARYPGKLREVAWRELPEITRDGYVDLASVVNPAEETVTYALALLETPRDEKVVLHLGTSGAARVWVNGTRVFADDAYHPPRLDQANVAVTLRKGVNRVLLKLCEATGPYGFYLRVTLPSGELAPGVVAVAPERLPPAPRGAIAAQTLPTLVEPFRRAAAARPNDALAVGEYAEMLSMWQAFDQPKRLDGVEAARAAKLAPKNANLQLLAGQTADDSNERRRFFEAALEAQPEHPRALEALARHYLGQDYARRALDLLDPVAERTAKYFPLALMRAHALDDMGLSVRAEALVDELARAFPDRPEVVREAARMARRRDRAALAIGRYRVAVAMRYDDLDSRRGLVALLSDTGNTAAALKEQRELNLLDPWNVYSWLRTAELAAANGRPEESAAAFARARDIAPDDAEVHEREGRVLARLGESTRAIASLNRALELKPQNPQLKETLKALRGEAGNFGEEFAWDAAELAKKPAVPGEDAVALAELTAVKVLPSGLSQRFEQLVMRVQTARGVESERNQWITYSPDRQELRIVRARVLRPDGSVLETHTESERGLSDNSVKIYYDTRARLISFPNLAPGDVLELTWRLDDTANDNLLSDYFGDVQLVQGDEIKQRFDYYLLAPAGRAIYAKGPDGLERSESEQSDGGRLYHWAARDVARVVPEPGMPAMPEVSTPLHVSTYKDWDAVGRYYWGLVHEQLAPTDELRAVVKELQAKVKPGDERAMVREVYGFVVNRTRYVGLEFGIHGFKPYKVDKVLARRFGDCKDKASLMHALLEVAGIDSRLVLLRMRRLGRVSGDPASLAIFDHAILYVPKFDLYLDGTAELHGSRELPVQDRGAMVLVIEPHGGTKLGQIPESRAAENVTASEFEVSVAANGQATLTGKTSVSGLFAPDYRRTYQAQATRKQSFEQGWARTFPGLAVKELTFSDLGEIERDVQIAYKMDVPRYAQSDNGGMAFTPFGQDQSYLESYASLSARKHDLVLSYPWTVVSHHRIKLPAGFAASVPEDVTLSAPYGRLELKYRAAGESIDVTSTVSLEVARVAAGEYGEFRQFLAKVDEAFARKVRLTKAIKVPAAQ